MSVAFDHASDLNLHKQADPKKGSDQRKCTNYKQDREATPHGNLTNKTKRALSSAPVS